MAYELVNKLEALGQKEMLELLASYVTKTERLQNKKHTVFQPSFDWKECLSLPFSLRRMSPLNNNPTQKSTPSPSPEKKQGVPRRVSR